MAFVDFVLALRNVFLYRFHYQQNTTISMQPRCGIPVHFNTHTRSYCQRHRQNSHPILYLAKQDIIDLLTVTLNNMYFSFNGQVFRQKEVLPMGSNISGILAILFMDRLETIALSSHLSISPYRRYVDDIYLQTTGEEMADQFHYTMNNLHPKLKFEIEKPEIAPNILSLSLLDFKITIFKDGKSSFEFYKETSKEATIRPPPIRNTGKVKDQLHSS